VKLYCIYLVFGFSGGRRELTGRIAIVGGQRQFAFLLPGLWRLIERQVNVKCEIVPIYAVQACRGNRGKDQPILNLGNG
jgi:hypothetical protein